jgi:hypothetical protein
MILSGVLAKKRCTEQFCVQLPSLLDSSAFMALHQHRKREAATGDEET